MQRNISHRRSRGGFSLIELLIAIAIILILAGLLLPAVTGAKKRAHAVACLATMRDIGTILTLYEQEHNGYPSLLNAGSGNKLAWGLGGKQGSIVAGTCNDDGSGLPTLDLSVQTRPLNRLYELQSIPMKEYKAFRCPADKGTGDTDCPGDTSWDATGSSYLYVIGKSSTFAGRPSDFGADLGGLFDPGTGRGYRRAGIQFPAKKIAVVEPQFLCDRSLGNPINHRHYFKGGNPSFSMSNVLFADGSVRFLVRLRDASGVSCNNAADWQTNAGSPDAVHDWY